MMRRFCFSARKQQSLLEALADLILRLVVGFGLAFAHGLAKLPPSDQFVNVIAQLGFPLPYFFAWCATAAELLGGILLAVGLLTRPAALSIAFTMGVAAFLRHGADPFLRKELALVYLAVSLWFFVAGAGRLSVDALISSRRRS